MPRPMSRAQRRAALLEAAVVMIDRMEKWYDEHPDASFGEIEAQARQLRRELMGNLLGIMINGRDSGYRVEPPSCPSCAKPMEFDGYRPWTVRGLEGDTALSRAYYVCPNCEGQTLFPPRPEATVARRPLE